MSLQILGDDAPYDFQTLNRDLDRVKSKVFLGSSAAFLGSLMCSLDFVWSAEIETAGTDGEKFYWAPNDFLRLPLEERIATVLHELWHVARLHIPRRGNRDPHKWNYACDIRINRDLRKEKGWVLPIPLWVQNHPECPHELEEDIYDWLVKNPSKMPKGGNQNDHMIPGSAKNKQKMVNAVVKAMTQAKLSKQPGAIPGDIEKIVNTFLAPNIAWEVVFQKFFTDLLDEDFTWRRPNRRHDPNVLYLPSMFIEEGRLEHLMYFWDVSGSIGDKEEIRFNSEMKYVWDVLQPKKLTLVQFDTKITKVDEFNEGDQFKDIKIKGKGGTSLVPVREYILKHKPTAAVIFSDLFCSPMQKLDQDIPTIWVTVNNPQATVPFGQLLHMKV